MTKILVTGGTGFIGSHLVERLVREGRDVRVLVNKKSMGITEEVSLQFLTTLDVEMVYGDILDTSSLEIATNGIDVVYHLAAISRPMNVADEQYHATNVQGTCNILKVVKDKNIKRFIHASTVSVLGVSPNGKPLKEDDFQYDDLQYGLSKREGELFALNYSYKYNIPLVVIRPCLVYGPRCLVRLVLFKFVKFGLFPLFNNGAAKMEFAYVDNVVEALILAEKKKNVLGEVFNITDGQAYSIKEVLTAIASELGVRPPFINISPKLGEYMGYAAELVSKVIGIYPPFSHTASAWMSGDVNVYDCTKAKTLLGYNPKVDLKTGIKRTVAWYKEKGLL